MGSEKFCSDSSSSENLKPKQITFFSPRSKSSYLHWIKINHDVSKISNNTFNRQNPKSQELVYIEETFKCDTKIVNLPCSFYSQAILSFPTFS